MMESRRFLFGALPEPPRSQLDATRGYSGFRFSLVSMYVP
jgi:hypothetical protein